MYCTNSKCRRKNYVALGDSISFGYGLASAEENFVNILTSQNGFTLDNKSENGNTAVGILSQFANNDWDGALKEAHLITLTCGGNDMMDLLYDKIAEKYNESNDPDIVGDEITTLVSEGSLLVKLRLLTAAQDVLEGDPENGVPAFTDTEEFAAELMEFENNLKQVMSYIRNLNSEAIIIMTTQYNPYKSFEGSTYDIVYQEMEKGAERLSKVISNNAASSDYLVADVRAAFDADSRNLCNATADPLDLDFHPNKEGHAVIAECVQAVYDSVAKEEPPVAEPPVTECPCADFTDIDRNAWYHEAVDYVIENDIMNGIGDNKFDPNGITTRAQIVMILWNLENNPAPASENVFSDVESGRWYEEAIIWAYENGIASGYGDTFGPDDKVTREQVAAFLHRYAKYKGYDVSKGSPEDLEKFHDADEVSGWAVENIEWAIAEGILNGDGQGGLNPRGNAKRCEVAQMIYSYLE